MSAGKQHELIRDASLTVGAILKRYLPTYLGGAKIDVVYEPPAEAALAKAAKDKTILLSVLWIDAQRSKAIQTTNTPIVHEEDEEGNVVEYRCGAPTYISPRYLVSAWAPSPLEAQVVAGALLQHFSSYPEIDEDDVEGTAIHIEDKPAINVDESLTVEDQVQLWSALGQTYRPSVVLLMNLRMDSLKRVPVRRVREKVNIFRKVEG